MRTFPLAESMPAVEGRARHRSLSFGMERVLQLRAAMTLMLR